MIELKSLNDWFHSLPIFFLYAEIHYKILKLPSRLFHRWPEIIADIPHRIEPGKMIPICLMIKDANRFPVQLDKVWLEIRDSNDEIKKIDILTKSVFVDSSWWDQLFEIDSPFEGEIWIDVFISTNKKSKNKIFKNDNYRRSSHASFNVFIAKDRLPVFPNQYYGDLHCHSNYTSDQVEFGAPLKAIKKAAEASGISFVAITDHSYDLDDQQNNFLKNDPTLKKWKIFQKEIAELNNTGNKNSTYLIPGEEVSIANKYGRNVHFLVLNSSKFYEGYGDSAEKWFRTRAKWHIKNLLNDLSDDALAIIPHPFISVSALEYIFLRRGNIKKPDYQFDRIDGLQILNSTKNPAFFRGLENWKKQLLAGGRLFIYAGNDSHGNFNYYRQIKIPHWNLLEKNDYIFGKVKTAITIKKKLSLAAIIEALRNGHCYITDGPAINFSAIDESGKSFKIGDQVQSNSCNLQISVLSTSEFGLIKKITIFWGSFIQKEEIVHEKIQVENSYSKDFSFSYFIKEEGYFRIEVATEKKDKLFNAYSNPIWVKPQQTPKT